MLSTYIITCVAFARGGWEVINAQLGFCHDECPFAENLLCIPRRDKLAFYVEKRLLHKPGGFEMHDFQVKVSEYVGRIRCG